MSLVRVRHVRHGSCSHAPAVFKIRPLLMRGLRLYSAPDSDMPLHGLDVGDVHVMSRFQSVRDPDRFALYVVRDSPDAAPVPPEFAGPERTGLAQAGPVQAGRAEADDDHTLVVVREFRRVPLSASALALMVFRARPGLAAQTIATLAFWMERAVSLYQPSYLLLARSLHEPRLTMLLTGVHECTALQAARPSAFSVDQVLPSLEPLIEGEPELYLYCPRRVRHELTSLIAPGAV